MSEDFMAPILLVEDNEDDIFIMKRVLRLAQIKNPLQVVTDGQQALDYLSGLREFGDREKYPLPFIIFLDLKLPYLDGFEVLTWIKGQLELSSIVVVVLTSSAEEKDQQKAHALGARSYLTKPPTIQSVKNVLDSLRSYWIGRSGSLPVSPKVQDITEA